MDHAYQPPVLTVDGVVFQLVHGELAVLLIQRANDPFRGMWALPGGYNAASDTTRQALDRVLTTKVGINLDALPLVEQLYTFDTVARDPRGPAVSVTYMGLARDLDLRPSSNSQNPTLFPVDQLPDLAYDHGDIIRYAYERLTAKITYTNAVFALLPPLFTLTRLQAAYEAILGRPLDKRNFRKKFLAYDMLEATGQYHKDGAHRPALLYRFRRQELQSLQRSFD